MDEDVQLISAIGKEGGKLIIEDQDIPMADFIYFPETIIKVQEQLYDYSKILKVSMKKNK